MVRRYLHRINPLRWLHAWNMSRVSDDRLGNERAEQNIREQLYLRREWQHGGSRECENIGEIIFRNGFTKTRFLPYILDGNMNFYDGDYDEAIKCYKKVIRKTYLEYYRLMYHPFRLRERRKIEYISIMLALLHYNLAIAYAEKERLSPEVIIAFRKAIKFQPTLSMLRTDFAFHYADCGMWDEAESLFRVAHALSTADNSEEVLNINIAYLRSMQAEHISKDESRIGEGVEILEDSIRLLKSEKLFSWLGKTHFTLAKLHMRLNKVAEAASHYEESAEYYLRASKKQESMKESASYMKELLAEIKFDQKDDEAALKLFESALELSDYGSRANTDSSQQDIARLKAKTGLVLLVLNQYEEASIMLDKSMAIWRDLGWFAPLVKIINDCKSMLERDDLGIELKMYIQQQIVYEKDRKLVRNFVSALRRCNEASIKKYEEPGQKDLQGESVGMLPVTTPLVLEVDERFLDAAGGPDEVLDKFIPAMRDRIKNIYGVKVPGIRVRANDYDLPYGTYVLMMHEIPLRSNIINLNQCMYVGDNASLEALGIKDYEDFGVKFNQQAVLVDREKTKISDKPEIEFIDTLDIPVRDFEDLIVANMIELVGHQEVQNMLEEANLINVDGDSIVSGETCMHMDPVTNVIRALLAERVPVNDFTHIYNLFKKLWDEGESEKNIVDVIRRDSHILPQLWGNNDSFEFYKLGAGLMELIEKGVKDSSSNVLALAPEDAQEILTAIRTSILQVSSSVLLVSKQSIRSVVRELVKIEFPDLPVLAMIELKPGLGGKVKETIESGSASAAAQLPGG